MTVTAHNEVILSQWQNSSDILITKTETKTRMIDFSFTETKNWKDSEN